jgi:alanyl-tRNA synthetase
MTSDELREAYLGFFEERGHKRLPSGSLVPASYDPSVLLTTAGMQPLKPYFLGQEQPPHPRLTTCQKSFRTVDIDVVGTTARHNTFFEMLGNFSIGDYFKQRAVELAWEFSLEVLKFDAERVWITVFGGDDALGLGPDEEAIEAWLSVGVPRERIVLLGRDDNFWQAGPTGPCGPCSELYYDRGPDFGSDDERPGDDTERFLEYWNLVFMQFNQEPVGTLTPLPAQSVDTGLGLNRTAAILQDVPSSYDTDQFRPLLDLAEELSGKRYEQDFPTTRAMRIMADHTRGATFLVADGVVPSNEERGYVLRRIMRRAIQQGRSLGMEPGFMTRFAVRVEDIMGGAYPELAEQRDSIHKWMASEEESFGRTLEQGTRLLSELIKRAREQGEEGIGADDAFRLHDTYGFPFELTKELVAEHDLGVDEAGFQTLMEEQRRRAREAGSGTGAGDADRDRVLAFAGAAGSPTRFTGYETLEQHTTVQAAERENGRVLVKLAESPFYAAGGGQISDSGLIECEHGDCRGRIAEVFRLGDDQAVVVQVETGELEPGERVVARVDPAARRATEANHTATHLLHAALRRRLGTHVRQAGSYVGPDKLRFDFTHGGALTEDELHGVEDEVNGWILENHPVHALQTSLDEAKRLGAMALFGEKYGDVVRMVEVGEGDFSRELCGGTHVRSTAEIGVFRVTSETSSAANVRRIEALTGPAAIDLLRRHEDALDRTASLLRTTPDNVPDAVADLQRRQKDLERAARSGATESAAVDVDALAQRAEEVDGVKLLAEQVTVPSMDALLALLDKVKGKVGDGVVVLGAADPEEGKVHLVASATQAAVVRGAKADDIVRAAAGVVGGGGGGRDTLARAGGKDPAKLPDAIEEARRAVRVALGG